MTRRTHTPRCEGSSLLPAEAPTLPTPPQTPHTSGTDQLAWQRVVGTLDGVSKNETHQPLSPSPG